MILLGYCPSSMITFWRTIANSFFSSKASEPVAVPEERTERTLPGGDTPPAAGVLEATPVLADADPVEEATEVRLVAGEVVAVVVAPTGLRAGMGLAGCLAAAARATAVVVVVAAALAAAGLTTGFAVVRVGVVAVLAGVVAVGVSLVAVRAADGLGLVPMAGAFFKTGLGPGVVTGAVGFFTADEVPTAGRAPVAVLVAVAVAGAGLTGVVVLALLAAKLAAPAARRAATEEAAVGLLPGLVGVLVLAAGLAGVERAAVSLLLTLGLAGTLPVASEVDASCWLGLAGILSSAAECSLWGTELAGSSITWDASPGVAGANSGAFSTSAMVGMISR